MKTGRYTIYDLFNSTDIEQIIIPEIQRDYVWAQNNVEGLFNSIYENFRSKTEIVLEIKAENHEVDKAIQQHLQKEYYRLRFNTRIGFIYAYHNPDYADKYFLIDGQQRITTIYLLLLAVYKTSGKQRDFAKRYFVNNLPKIDYKVREVSHDFMVNFIEWELSHDSQTSFKESGKFYDIYSHDQTAHNLFDQYEYLYGLIKTKISNTSDFLDYIENYIEFNYFDTNLSEQGERLYLYMNSRGESLSEQEKIRCILVRRAGEDTLKAGEKWEEWQNFFWTHRDNNENADKGFYEFLKWAAIIHMNTYSNPSIKEKRFSKKDGRLQSEQEVKEEYISLNKKEEQPRWIRDYIAKNSSFHIEYLSKIHDAVKRLTEVEDLSRKLMLPPKWLSDIDSALSYPSICGCIYYLQKFPQADERNIERVAMYIANLCSEITNRKNPDATTIRAIELVKSMVLEDIRDLLKKGTEGNYFNPNDDFRVRYLDRDNRECWENIFYTIIRNRPLNDFLRGNHNFLIELWGENATAEEAQRYTELFKEKIYTSKNSDELRKSLLRYGDISVSDDGGSWIKDQYYNRMCLLLSDSDDKYWFKFLYSKEGKPKDNSLGIIKNYLDNAEAPDSKNESRILLSIGLHYMKQKKYLYHKGTQRYFLLNGHQAREDKYIEPTVYYLHTLIEHSFTWSHNYCAVNFAQEDGFIKKGINNAYYIDIILDRDNRCWICELSHRTHSILSDDIVQFFASQSWEYIIEKNTQYLKIKIPVSCQYDTMNAAAKIKEWFDKLWLKIESHPDLWL